MTKSRKNKITRYAFLLILIIGIGFLIFNESGYVKYFKLKNEVNELNLELENKKRDNKNLEAEIDSLVKKKPAKIEKVAREKYGMMKKGEKVIKIEEK